LGRYCVVIVRLYTILAKYQAFSKVLIKLRVSWDSTVGMATSYGLDNQGVGVQVVIGSRIFSSSRCPDRLAHPASYPMRTDAPSPGLKRKGGDAEPSPPISAKVNKTWIHTFTPSYVFMTWRFIS
jgi:hypothetical protein